MTWTPKSTKGVGMAEPHKVLLYGHHGWGKTWQVRKFQERYGKGLLLSGERGLKSLADVDVDHVQFTSWDGAHDPDNDVFSFRGLAAWISSPAFRELGYKWIALDSLTELSEMLYVWAQKEVEGQKGAKFALWDVYGTKMLSTMKWIRDLPYHVYVTSLAAESNDDATGLDYWPHVKGAKVAKAIPAIFDHVFCAIKKDEVADEKVKTTRYIVTDQMYGWHGKVRDPFHRIESIEQTDDITELLDRMTRTKEDEEKRVRDIALAEETRRKVAEATAQGAASGAVEKMAPDEIPG